MFITQYALNQSDAGVYEVENGTPYCRMLLQQIRQLLARINHAISWKFYIALCTKNRKIKMGNLVFDFLYLLFLWEDENMVVHNYAEISGSA